MTLETIMQVLYANKLTDVIVLATKIDNNIVDPTEKGVGQNITIRVGKEELSKLGLQPKENKEREYWFNVQLPVIAVNKYALQDKYLVDVAGKLKWVAEEDGELSVDVESIPAPVHDQTFG